MVKIREKILKNEVLENCLAQAEDNDDNER